MGLNPVFNEIITLKILSWIKEVVALRRFHPDKHLCCEKDLKNTLDPDVVVHAFYPSTQKTEAGRYPGLRSDWSIVGYRTESKEKESQF